MSMCLASFPPLFWLFSSFTWHITHQTPTIPTPSEFATELQDSLLLNWRLSSRPAARSGTTVNFKAPESAKACSNEE